MTATNINKSQPIIDNRSLSPRTIWGRVVVKLREQNNIALHIICGDITDVSMENDVFVLSVSEDYIINLLLQPENSNELKKAFNSLGISDYKITKKQKQKDVTSDIETLKRYFGDYLKIKE